ncbi:leucyl/phenylalanyl-tRNA--protein transferase [Capsulimonas corticalis]|uniref:Leucyl/phenylalanyl-tRNA--protein transferase n=1 Tax=Capsulimonas corticalis TaxID=2219043 RepID=A0A402D484_9BACT|nr:leucyl/phenylalanyl-tRNA--protein transferase [Capsulimonas corticalis]BDI29207.1 leucyl/phenylalanyl-tRNA--protein transferase [Capsulimonas corticalis]
MRTDQRPDFIIVDPRDAGEAEVIGMGGAPTVASLLWAYRHGVFPWPVEGYPLLWFCPPARAIIEFADLRVPERLARMKRNAPFSYTIDQAFPEVMRACQAAPRPGQSGTWITEEMLDGYGTLHQRGFAHSVEVWDSCGALVGGLYGVSVDGAFAGESMFHSSANTSKLALLHLIEHLQQRGLDWIDIQMLTPHLVALGAKEVARSEFLDRLERTQTRKLSLFGQG